jgi:hypothetical protein
MDYTDAEQHAGRRDALALIAAMHRGDDDAYNGILDMAGDRGCRAIAESLVYIAYGNMLRTIVAASQLPDDASEAITSADLAAIAAVPGLLDAVGAHLAEAQAELAAEPDCRA